MNGDALVGLQATSESTVAMEVLATELWIAIPVCAVEGALLRVYVPIPPVPVPKPVMVVLAGIVPPVIVWPTTILPAVTAETVRVLELAAMVPVKLVAGVLTV